MFPAIARPYDWLTHWLTFSLDRRWRERAADAAGLRRGDRVLDLATGTGELALALARRVGPSGRVIGVDLTRAMLAEARRKIVGVPYDPTISLIEMDASRSLPFPDESFHAATMGLALRYFDAPVTISEMARVVKPGGRVVILDFAIPTGWWAKPGYWLWAFGLMPLLGGLLARDRQVYNLLHFLPRSVSQFHDPAAVEQIMRAAGLSNVGAEPLTLGITTLFVGTKLPHL
jgi:demethylmenaquinone methyltransferase/2-methoxy-6-polyprenyl-1,4-benzoquinol methylase